MKITATLTALALVYLVALAGLYLFQRKLLYFPGGAYVSPQAAGAPDIYREIAVQPADGLDLKGWYAPAADKPYTIVFFHGNNDRLRTVYSVSAPYLSAGYGFLLTEYRGYSGLPGSPTESGLYADGRAFISKLVSMGVPENRLILMGYSLGSGVAVQMAREFHPAALILIAPFTSVPAAAQKHFPIFPAKYMVKDLYANIDKIGGIHVPLLIANGGRDKVVPPAQGRALFAAANQPKDFFFAPEATHIDIFQSDFYAASLSWLKKQIS